MFCRLGKVITIYLVMLESVHVFRSTHNDEMCNLYIMYYTANGGKSYYLCADSDPELVSHIPADSDVPLPPNPILDAMAVGHMHHGTQVQISMFVFRQQSCSISATLLSDRPGSDFLMWCCLY